MPLRKPTTKSNTPSRLSKARLAAMIEEATVDAYGESEQTTGGYTMLEEHLALPFDTTGLAPPHFATREFKAFATASAGVNTATPSIVVP